MVEKSITSENSRETQLPGLLGILRWLDGLRPGAVLAGGLGLIACLGGLGLIVGPQLSTSFLYLLPLLLITRVNGFRAGAVAAAFAAVVWLATELRGSSGFSHPFTPYWNMSMRLGTFLVAVGLVAATKSMNEHLESRVKERTSALERQMAETRELEKALLEVGDRERAAVGQDLHDGLCQQLVGVAFCANMLKDEAGNRDSDLVPEASRIADLLDEAITQARNLARGLYPVRLLTEGLEMAVLEMATTMTNRYGIPCDVDCPRPLPHLTENTAIQIYRIIQEAVANAAKHGKPNRIVIRLSFHDQMLSIEVVDNGMGVAATAGNPTGMGLSIMGYRARMVGAGFHLRENEPTGTRVECRLPITASPDGSSGGQHMAREYRPAHRQIPTRGHEQ